MQSKGTLGSIVAGVIAIFLVLVCLFYLSFSLVSNHYEGKAQAYAQQVAGPNASPDAINKAYKSYLTDSLGNKPIYLGYNYSEIQKWGVGLGLDLKGGMNVILQVSMPDILKSMKNAETDTVFDAALAATDKIVKSHQSDDFVGTFVKEYRQRAPQADYAVVFPNVVKAGSNDASVASTLKAEVKDRVNNSATNVLRSRIDAYGVVSPNIQVLQGKDGQILLELPGVKEHERVRDLLQRSANLEFYETYKSSEIAAQLQQLDAELRKDTIGDGMGLWNHFAQVDMQGSPVIGMATQTQQDAINAILASAAAKRILPANLKLLWEVKPQTVQFTDTVSKAKKDLDLYRLIALKTNNGKAALDGSCVIAARADYEQMQGNVVSMTMNNEGAKQWARVTGNNIGNCVAIVLDNYVYSFPRVNTAIEGGRSQITGDFTVEEAQDLANVLKSGKMNAKVEIISDMVIGPSLGQQAIKAGFISFIVALVLLMIFMMLIYGVIPGLVANLGLICNLFFTLGILASFQAVLTLSGIAGIVLALGMAVDANVLIFERAKEELRLGKNVRQAVADGYSNAFSAIFDSNLTSIITGVILLLYGTGPIKGFATTLIIGIICSFFTAVYLSRIVFILGAKSKWFQKLTFSTAISKNMLTGTKINFLGQRKVSFTVCGIFIAIVIGSLFVRGMNQGIDFSGGRNYVVKFDKPINTVDLQQRLAPEFPNSTVSVITIESSDQVRISTNYKINDDSQDVEKEIVAKLFAALQPDLRPGMTPEEFSTTDETQGILQSQKVGPTVADDMRNEAYIAVILSLIAMFLYILLRFRNVAFSVGALAAVAFTAFTIIGFYSIFWGVLPFAMEVDQTFIAAILTVIGYQINDTVVVFDRVRENLGLYPKQNFYDTVNQSVNATLSRTIITSGSTFLVLLCIFILGGDAIRSFTFAMLFGVITGTLATIYVASPVAYLIDARRGTSAKRSAALAK
ncbi:MAG: protein translocase subunit SecD [Bacteroidales bacterium]|nr:protein translocase subunit SecD [Bacteroidales bacterium]MCD8393770.1 protein translocase subunit SecD [Bacteroidales bacterium]